MHRNKIFILISFCILHVASTVVAFKQEWSVAITELNNREIRTIVIDKSDNIWFGTGQGLIKYNGTEWKYYCEQDGLVHAKINALAFDEIGKLWIATEGGVSIFINGQWQNITSNNGLKEDNVQTIAPDDSAAWIGTPSGANYIDENGVVTDTQLEGENIQAIAVDSDATIWYGTTTGLHHFDGHSWKQYTAGADPLLSNNIRGLAFDHRDNLWIATNNGVNVLDSTGVWLQYTGKQGLGCENVYSVAIDSVGAKWFATEFGIAKFTEDYAWDWYMSNRWLPSGVPHAVAAIGDGSAWFGTNYGANKLVVEEFTFEQKAQFFEERIRSRHLRLGFVSKSILSQSGDLSSNQTFSNANDGLWTGIYVAAEAFRYAVTGDQEAKRFAKDSFNAMIMLQKVTEGVVPKEGYFARSFVPYNEELGTNTNWHHSADGKWTWRGDTSSDELVGHMFAYYVYHELIADAIEKVRVRNLVATIMDHVIDNDLYLIDYDGYPTRWGVWNPDLLNRDPSWIAEKGLNSLQILSALKVAYHITGEARFDSVYHYLIDVENYDDNTIGAKYLGEINHSDDELAFLAYYPLLQLEHDPDLRATYLESIDRSWGYEAPERSSLFNYIYHTAYPIDPEKGDDEAALINLMLWPMDLVTWSFDNSFRDDVEIDTVRGRRGELQSVMVLPVDQRPAEKWNENPYRLIGGNGGYSEQPGSEWLLPYWLGRYHGYLKDSPTAVFDQENHSTISGFVLSQNYPNPFNANTIINYELTIMNYVEICVYNLLGQKIVTLVSEVQPAGYHQAEFNAQNLSSGVYLYRIKAGAWSDVRKMVLVR